MVVLLILAVGTLLPKCLQSKFEWHFSFFFVFYSKFYCVGLNATFSSNKYVAVCDMRFRVNLHYSYLNVKELLARNRHYICKAQSVNLGLTNICKDFCFYLVELIQKKQVSCQVLNEKNHNQTASYMFTHVFPIKLKMSMCQFRVCV